MQSHNGAKATVKTLSLGAFSQHELTEVRPYFWRCSRGKSWTYGFFVVVGPGAIGIYGDLGEAWFRMSEGSEDNVIRWLRSSINDPSYVLSKVASPTAWKSFYEDDALRWARENVADCGSQAARVLLDRTIEEVEDGMLSAERWGQLVIEHDEDVEVASIGVNWSAQAYWIVEALRCFITLYDNQQRQSAT